MEDGQASKGEAAVRARRASSVPSPSAASFDIAVLPAHAGGGVFKAAADGRLLHVTARLAALFGFASPDEMLAAVGGGWAALIPPNRLAEFLDYLRDGGHVSGFEVELPKQRSGGALWVSVDVWATQESAGAAARYEGFVRDVSAHKRALVELQRSEERFRDFEATAKESYWETGPDHRLTLVPKGGAERIEGGDDPVGKYRWDIADEAAADPRKWRDFRRLLERRESFAEFRYRLRSPSADRSRVVAISGKPMFDGERNFLGYRGSARDLTDEIRGRIELEEARQRLKDFAETAFDWLWETDANHRFAVVDGAGRKNSIAPLPAIGMTRWEIADDVDEEPEKWTAHRAALARHEPFRDFVFRMRAGDGERHWISSSGNPIVAPDGTVRGYRGASRLVTELVRHADQLRAVKAQVESSNRGKTALLSRMSHEIRTSLNAIIGFAEIMGRELFGKIGTNRYVDYIADIRTSAQGLLKLVDNIADLSDAEAGKIVLDEAELDLNAAVRSAILMQRDAAKRRLVQVAESVAPNLPLLKGDRRRIRQILLTLLANAIRLSPRDGRVSLSAGQTRDGCLFLRVGSVDAGGKILYPPRTLGRPNPSLETGDDDSGLSFALCKELVELHGGTLRINDGADHGFIVEILFPRIRSIAAPSGGIRERNGQRGKPARSAADVPV